MSDPSVCFPRSTFLGFLVAATGCVLPSYDVSGMELSWRFLELVPLGMTDADTDGDDDDDDDTVYTRVRTCEGVGIDEVTYFVADLNAETRRGSFSFPCVYGFQTAEQASVQQSAAFIELTRGTYQVDIIGSGPALQPLTLSTQEVSVAGRTPTLIEFQLARPQVAWTLELANLEGCGTFSLGLFYADPVRHLADPAIDDSGVVIPTLYRPSLATDRLVSLGGVASPCLTDLAGTHAVAAIDPGVYRLEIVRDGVVCSRNIVLEDPAMPTSIDFANLGCQG